MAWTQTIETDDITAIDSLLDLIQGLSTNGDLQHVSLELEADQPIYYKPPEALTSESDNTSENASENASDTESGHKYSTKSGSAGTAMATVTDGSGATATSSPSSTSTTTSPDSPDTESEDDAEKPPVKYRKWPRLRQEIGIDSDVPLSGTAYPGEVREFAGTKEADVEHDIAYESKVNGTRDYGAFVTLNGTGYNPSRGQISGLLHHENMADGHDAWSFSQGDRVVVELVAHKEKGLSFRELYELDEDDAKEARYHELVRLSRLELEEGDSITFSDWPDEREQKGTITNIDHGRDDPATPPTIDVSGTGTTSATVRPSEIVATSNSIVTNTDTVEDPDPTEVGMDIQDDSEQEEATTNTASDTQFNARSMSASPDDTSVTDTADEDTDDTADEVNGEVDGEVDDDSESEDDDFVCENCGESDFDNSRQFGGHRSWCTRDTDDEEVEETSNSQPEATTTDGGTVVNPVLVEAQYDYTKVAVALYEANADRLTVREIGDLLAETDWAMGNQTIQNHLSSLMEKEAVDREEVDYYEYGLTGRGQAGVERVLDENGLDVPDF